MPTPLRFSTLVLVGVALLPNRAVAREPAPGEDPEAAEPNGAEQVATDIAADIVSEEPEVPGKVALAHNAKLLDELLTRSTEQTIREKKFGAAAGIAGGSILIGLAGWRLIENEPQSAYTRGLGVMFMTLGVADLTTGIYAATRVPHERRRLERWEKARKDGITEVELAHFEGELQSSSEIRQGENHLVRWNGLTHAIAGVLVLSFTPIPDGSSRTDRVSGYVVGSLFIATGMAAFGASFRGTPSERAWSEYNKRKVTMTGHQFSWRVTPSVSRRGAGLFFGATF